MVARGTSTRPGSGTACAGRCLPSATSSVDTREVSSTDSAAISRLATGTLFLTDTNVRGAMLQPRADFVFLGAALALALRVVLSGQVVGDVGCGGRSSLAAASSLVHREGALAGHLQMPIEVRQRLFHEPIFAGIRS